VRPLVKVRADKVYRIEVTGRCEGQIEDIFVQFRRKYEHSNYLWYGGDRLQPRPEWSTQVFQVKPPQNDDRGALWINLRGVGTYLLRSVRIVEVDGWDLPPAPAPRGELLANGTFSLGALGGAATPSGATTPRGTIRPAGRRCGPRAGIVLAWTTRRPRASSPAFARSACKPSTRAVPTSSPPAARVRTAKCGRRWCGRGCPGIRLERMGISASGRELAEYCELGGGRLPVLLVVVEKKPV